MTSDELRERIAACEREARAMSAHRDHEFAAGARVAADGYRQQLRNVQAAERERAPAAA